VCPFPDFCHCSLEKKRAGRKLVLLEAPEPVAEGNQPPYQKPTYSLFQNRFLYHPEQSEGSQGIENTRFFATLRMTIA
jgi:hypothetical protein